MNWYRKCIFAGYSNELAYLRDSLKGGFDPNDFPYKIVKFLENEGSMKDEWVGLEDYEVLEAWLKIASEDEIESFKEYITGNTHDDPYYEPPYLHVDYKSLNKPSWLVHFTDNARDIEINGFKYGHPEIDGVHLTTWKKNRQKEPGYNFAFELGTRNASNTASSGKYGKEAVIFWGAGVEIYHYGDDERQIVVWGPSINLSMIFAMYRDGSEWYVPGVERERIVAGDFDRVSYWITENYRMLINIKNKTLSHMGKKPY